MSSVCLFSGASHNNEFISKRTNRVTMSRIFQFISSNRLEGFSVDFSAFEHRFSIHAEITSTNQVESTEGSLDGLKIMREIGRDNSLFSF